MLGLAHIPTSKDIYSCAYTQKIINLSKMLKSLGHKIILYGTEGSVAPWVDELVIVSRESTRKKVYGDYDWKSQFFKHEPTDEAHVEFNNGCIAEINDRKMEKDFLLCPMGTYDQPIAEGVKPIMVVESGIGYLGVFSTKKVFESYAWMHFIYGMAKKQTGEWYDVVIPNSYDMLDFPYTYSTPESKDDYYLFIGRLIKLKGIQIAIDATEAIGAKLIVAGQGSLSDVEGLDLSGYKHVTHVGSVDPKQRFELMSKARATFVPTCYIGPFEGVAVESQLCGTPVITSDFGVFNETVQQGITGYKCRTHREFVNAAENWYKIDPMNCRAWAVQRYSMEVVRLQYQVYFDRLFDLWGNGWYQLEPYQSTI